MTLKAGWYGDDFTGATDTLAVAARAGWRTLLFLDVPTPAQLALAGELDALGVAGSARTMSPQQMREALPRIGEFFRRMHAPVLLYKCCSTFDSSAQTGSLGAAISVLSDYVEDDTTYVVGGQPDIGRFCCFSNLFAAAGAGGEVCRLDRHATMKKHPVTPMNEADLRRHLKRQGIESVLPVHYPQYERIEREIDDSVDALLSGQHSKGRCALLFDVARAADLAVIGRQLARRSEQGSLLAVGPSAVVQALAAHWHQTPHSLPDGLQPLAPAETSLEGGPAAVQSQTAKRTDIGAVFVFVGSMSPVTAMQVRYARSYEHVPIDGVELIENPSYADVQHGFITASLDAGRHVLAYVPASSASSRTVPPGDLARATADFIKRVVDQQAAGASPLRRLGVAGGDTSSLAARALDIWALGFAGVLAPGVTLCRAHSDDSRLHGLELMLKGGQMGSSDIFERLLVA
ncbi:MAG: four-carbon acid sugar kinase family protein [Candidimonas sp.]|nr:MAG: four-carbon acid sugar kinase family protein [Candidimonas sp.]TAM25380.1 MAG: four-carbon acid sugar kinase family protein [Candidimonas sp.]